MSPRSIAKSDRVPRSAPARLSAASILRVGSESLASVFVLCKDSFFVRLISSVAPADCPAACERADWSVLAPARRVFGRFKIFLSRSYSGLRPVHQGWVRDFRSQQVESSRPGRFRRPRAQVCSAPRFSRRACKASSPIPAPVPSRFFRSVSARLRPGSLLPGFPDSRSLDLFAALDIHLRHRVSVPCSQARQVRFSCRRQSVFASQGSRGEGASKRSVARRQFSVSATVGCVFVLTAAVFLFSRWLPRARRPFVDFSLLVPSVRAAVGLGIRFSVHRFGTRGLVL
jgi:hypothetical protein